MRIGFFLSFYLEMRTRDTFSNLLEERLLDLDELGGLDHVQNLLDLAQKHHLNNSQLDVSFVRKVKHA